ncbi:MAG: TylF/MycF/NovP-related O-methyltransferase [Vicinamibacterales bacterium]
MNVARALATYVHRQLGPQGYEAIKDRFIRNGRNSPTDESTRRNIGARFEAVHAHVPSQSSATDALIVAEAALSIGSDGDFVECGCFAGAMTAKLSIVASVLRKQLVVFDSFEGFPVVHAHEASDHHGRQTEACTWRTGGCRATLDEVSRNVTQFGDIVVCKFVQGWFDGTLTAANVPPRIALAYTDVALPSSARTCLVRLWPFLANGGTYFSRDVALSKVLTELSDDALWKHELQCDRPLMFGAGFGLSDASPYLGFMAKGGADAIQASVLRIFKPDTL